MLHNLPTSPASNLISLASDHKAASIEPLHVSAWVAMSALQKAIRRADVVLAVRAAATLLQSDPARLWRRLAGIVFEDIGLGSVETIQLVMTATSGKKVREAVGGEWHVASLVISRMCAAPKCRASDDLFIALSHNPELAELRADLAAANLFEHLRRVESRGALLGAAIAALHASGARWTGQVAGEKADAKALFGAMASSGIDHAALALAELGWRRTREALPILLPLLTLAMPTGELSAVDDEFPPVVIGHSGIPTYCLDAFSWEGKAALSRFLKRDTETGRWLGKNVSASRRLSVLAGGLFRVEGGLVRQRVEWPCASTLRWLADSGYHRQKVTDPAAFLAMVRADLPALDEVRHDVR